jgi:hypothetical protein
VKIKSLFFQPETKIIIQQMVLKGGTQNEDVVKIHTTDIYLGRPMFRMFIIFYTNPFLLILGNIIPAAAIIFAQRFPPAPIVTFHSDTQKVHWQCTKKSIEVPFATITFSPVRLPSKSGISNVFVMVSAFADKPFFENEKPSNESGALYKKDLCLYKAGTKK